MTRLLALWVATTNVALASTCPVATYSTDLSESIHDAKDTFADLDIVAFKAATDRLAQMIPCLEDPITGSVAADVHRFQGIRAFSDRDDPLAQMMFAAARKIEPSYVFPETLIPAGNPVRLAYEAADLGDGAFVVVPTPAQGYLQFDGRTTQRRNISWPTLYQRVDGAGAIVETAYLLPEDELPTYRVRQGDCQLVLPEDPDVETDPPKELLIATIASGAAAVALYGAAGVSKARFSNLNTADDKLEGLAGQANGLVIASGLAGAATLGLGVGVALRW